MRNFVFTRELRRAGEKELEAKAPGWHLSSSAGLLDDNLFNRTYWLMSKGFPDIAGYQSPKAGQILCWDDSATYSARYYIHANIHSPMNIPGREGILVTADRNTTEPYRYNPRKKGIPRPIKWLPTADGEKARYDAASGIRAPGYRRKEPALWHTYIPVRVRAIVKTANRLYVAGAPDVLDEADPLAAYEGRAGAALQVLDPTSGKTIQKKELSYAPVFDGMIGDSGRLYISGDDGYLHCYSGKCN